MKRRPTILALMGLIAFIAVGMVALRSNDEAWSDIISTLTLAVLGTATVLAMHRRGGWLGFAVFGWAQLLICQIPANLGGVGPVFLPVKIVYLLVPRINDHRPSGAAVIAIPGSPPVTLDDDGQPFVKVVTDRRKRYVGSIPFYGLQVGLCLSSLAVGGIGAAIGMLVARSPIARRESPASGGSR